MPGKRGRGFKINPVCPVGRGRAEIAAGNICPGIMEPVTA